MTYNKCITVLCDVVRLCGGEPIGCTAWALAANSAGKEIFILFQIDVMSRKPVYEQIVDQLQSFVLAGVISSGECLPSVRSLSMELSVNPNTVQKAYSELDLKGIIVSVPGRGNFVSENAYRILSESKRQDLKTVGQKLRELRLAGITKEEIITLVDTVYGEDMKNFNINGEVSKNDKS